MKQIGVIENHRAAQGFVDYMALSKVKVEVRPDSQGHVELWANEGADFDKAEQEWAEFIKQPFADKYLDAAWDAAPKENPFKYQPQGPGIVKTVLTQAGPLTNIILILCILAFLLQPLFGVYNLLAYPVAGPFSDGEIWRLITPMFMHFGLMHIAFNLGWWWYLGGAVERYQGNKILLPLVLFSAVISNFGQYMLDGAGFGGLSGVVYAMIGYCWLYGRRFPRERVGLPDNLFGFALIWLSLGFTGFMNMANGAHLIGLLAGLAYAQMAKGQKG